MKESDAYVTFCYLVYTDLSIDFGTAAVGSPPTAPFKNMIVIARLVI